MKKCKLPKDWIVVHSKSHPDRVYYFNVTTKQSTWTQPAAHEISSEHINRRCKNYDKKERYSRATTPEYNFAKDKDEIDQRQSLHNDVVSQTAATTKEKDTPQMKMLRERILERKLQKSAAKNKISSVENECDSSSLFMRKTTKVKGVDQVTKPSKRSPSKLIKSEIIPSSSSNLTDHDKHCITSVLEQNGSKTITFTPQMRALQEKIQQRKLGISNLDDQVERSTTSKQQRIQIPNEISKTQGEQESTMPNRKNINRNNDNIKQNQSNRPKKNLARERMQKLRRSLKLEKKIAEEAGCSNASTKSLQRFNRSLPTSHCSGSVESASMYKNVETRLKRLHNKVFRDTMYEKRVASKNNKSHIQQSKQPVVTNMTTHKLIEQINQEVLCEEMDWEPMQDEEITLQVEVVRTQLGKERCPNVTNYISQNSIELTQPIQSQEKGPLYIVIDTNVFLSNLQIIEEARDIMFKTYPRPFIVIPWTVICELDYLKDDKSKSETLHTKSRKAISFINEHFSSKHPRFIGQTREQAAKNKQDFSLECPDDEILQCCLQIRELRKSVVLLSYDKNLCTKAMIYDIMALGRHDPLEKIDYLNVSDKIMNTLANNTVEHSLLNEELLLSDDIFEDTKAVMKDFLSAVIIKQMSDIYGSDWEMYVIIKPPWTVVNALKCIIKHWIAATSESFQTCSLSILKELLQIFQHLPIGGRKLQDVEHILEKCSDLIQMVNMDKHHELVVQLFNIIMELKKKCLKCIIDIDQKKLHDKIGIVEDAQEQKQRAEKAFQCFKQIYNYARDFCGLAANIAGMAFPLHFCPINPTLPHITVKRLQPEITRKVTDLTQNLNKLLIQTEDSIKHQTLLSLQQNLNTFMAHIEANMFEVEVLDIYYCVKLKEDMLRMGLKQLQELNTHYCALVTYT